MASRRSVRQLLVAVLLGVLVGGGLMAVTPAGAEVAQAAATSWKKIWKKELKPLADKRYYQKSQSDTKYASKAEAAAAAAAAQSAATSAASSATDSKLGGYYKKTESDAKYMHTPAVIRGVWNISGSGGTAAFTHITYPQLAAAPTVKYIPASTLPPAGCSGTQAAPDASPGFLCIFESFGVSASTPVITVPDFSGPNPGASTFGASMWSSISGGSYGYLTGSYALRPAASGFSASKSLPSQSSSNPANRP